MSDKNFVKSRVSNKERKHEAIRARLKELYDGKRMRFDDCIKQLAKEFFMAELSIRRIVGLNNCQ